jgi:hypothetical protein
MTRHPDTGLHYGVVIPRDHGPFTDIRACYEHAARRFPWLSLITPGQDIDYGRDDLFVLTWVPLTPPPRRKRKATCAMVYSEALDADPTLVLPAHQEHFRSVDALFAEQRFDGVFGHTPRAAEILTALAAPTAVLPVGWEPEIMGRPRGTAPVHDLVYHGSNVGRRKLLVPFLAAELGPRFYDVTGSFGRSLLGALELARASLYIAHSRVESFSTWRCWQAMAAGCALVAEPGDAWPFEAERDYLPIGPLTLDSAEYWAASLIAILDAGGLEKYAEAALATNGDFTTCRMVEEYLMPASIAMAERARSDR